ncbi:hypothetical protein PAXRUDRAFT_380422 [Paxillus rubicundulus Ve08.2h10]|uniref:Uncharacterized protein n=1 Tax=Paxillus rubicundulus Ve08.2h10 TaxID=930991 RepID=A0A0D0E968_9AGAM|nr:hypothetical protein PAXRUDRAFT_380422 [Paxillus rubicundulus Ve08.2h10]
MHAGVHWLLPGLFVRIQRTHLHDFYVHIARHTHFTHFPHIPSCTFYTCRALPAIYPIPPLMTRVDDITYLSQSHTPLPALSRRYPVVVTFISYCRTDCTYQLRSRMHIFGD